MYTSRSVVVGLLAMALFLSTSVGAAPGAKAHRAGSEDGTPQLSRLTPSSEIQVTLSAAHRTRSWDDRLPDRLKFYLPLLYLHHEREGTVEADRTLAINISGLVGGTEIQIEAVSRHVNSSTGERHAETRLFPLPDRLCTSKDPCRVQWTLDASAMLSDFYHLRVKDDLGHLLWENPTPDLPDFVALDTWDVGLGEYTVRVTYAALFPFARGQNDLDNRLPPGAVTDFVEHQFLPIIVDTWNTQFRAWGFGPIHPDWDLDKVVEIFVTDPPFALFDGSGTYTSSVFKDGSPYPERRLWWFSSNTSFQAYDSLENGVKAVFAHEFFHMAQWNVSLSAGCSTRRWKNVFIEAQGKFAPSVQYPELEILKSHVVSLGSEYGRAAQRFLGLRLNTPYSVLEAERINRYDAALYWRFLYEQFGDMDIIRAALEEMACGYHPDIELSLGKVMDAALARFDGPIQTFEDSLIAFARANYALRLEDGRCTAADLAGCGGHYYDPHNMYTEPSPEAELDYNGSPLIYDGSIPASFGMDFVEVRLDRGLYNQPITITFQSEGARFNVEIWKLAGGGADSQAGTLLSKLGGGEARLHALTLRPETVSKEEGNLYVYSIPHLEPMKYDRLALIIIRLDPDERTNPAGDYHIRLDPVADTKDEGIAG